MRRSLGALALAAAGCSDPGPGYVPVRGTVRIDGRPADGAVLVFLPQPGSRVTGGAARTAADGTFDLYGSHGSGLEPGEYRVQVRRFVQPDGTPVPADASPDRVACRQEVPAPYSDRKATPLTVRVGAGEPVVLDVHTRRR